ncbi:MAG TPA: glycosyl hydrolase family 28 protein [Polyangia bacterium]|nr:glycosyl hydrolase family 28 protein [Polyangia bacterium]
MGFLLAGSSVWLTAGLALAASPPGSAKVAGETVDDTSLTVIWTKPSSYSAITQYRVYNAATGGTAYTCSNSGTTNSGNGPTGKPNLWCHITGRTANTAYTFYVRSFDTAESTTSTATSSVTTKAAPTIKYVDTYATSGSSAVQTAGVQNAINGACNGSALGRVVIKSGESFVSGNLNIPSNCTFQIDGTLTASTAAADFTFDNNRFPAYGTGGSYGTVHYPTNYRALLNVCGGSSTTCTGSNVRIVGSGTISGGSGPSSDTALSNLGYNQAHASGKTDSARADLLHLSGVNGLYIRGVHTMDAPAHVIFVARSTNVSVEQVNSTSYHGAASSYHNGDGIDLATSTNANIYGSSFDDGDDCINLNAGSNAPGVAENRPDGSSGGPIRIFDNTTLHGHGGVVFGSFTAAWIQYVTAEDNYHNGTDVGLRFKTGTNRGGGAQQITVRDTKLNNIISTGIEVTGSYKDSTGYAGPATNPIGHFKNITISNITSNGNTGVKSGAYAIKIDGNEGTTGCDASNCRHLTLNFSNIDIRGSGGKGISVYQVSSSTWSNVKATTDGSAAVGTFYYQPGSFGNTFTSCVPAPTAK